MRAGEIVADRFEVELLAGSGGVGQVYRAKDRVDGGHCALKVLKPPSSKDTDRFAREVRVLARLRHPSIVRYIAHGKTAAGEPFLAMEWLEGEDLAARVARGPLPVSDAVDVVRRAAEALAAAHAHGVIHRDIKPSNLFLRGGRLDDLKVLDFGLAWLVDASRELTRSGLVVGTLGYMAPEQAVGERAIDARTDVFALGCVLYRCITGRPAFDSDRIGAVLMKILHEDPPRMSESVPAVPPALDDYLARMLAKDPAARPDGAASVAEALAALGSSLPATSARSLTPMPQPALTHTERVFSCFVAVGKPVDWLAPHSSRLLVLFDVGTEQVDRVRQTVERFGGQLEVLADGSILCTLAAGASATDLASQAARCALALRELLPTAPIAVAMGRSDQTSGRLVGSPIDVAAELLRSAATVVAPTVGTVPVRIDATSAGLLDPSFDVGGDEGGLLLLGERPPVERPRLLLGKPTPCVGRERELAALQAAFDECATERVARMALTTGPPGSGKSRVRRELLRALRDRGDPMEIWLAAGQPLATGSPFALAGVLVRAAARLMPEDAPHVRRQKLIARVQRNLSREQVPRVARFLGEIGLAPFPDEGDLAPVLRAARADPALMADQVRRAWQDLLAAECAQGPVVLVLEDLHWGDLPSVNLVTGAVRRLHDQPLLVLGFARPEVHDLFPRLARDAAVQEIRLGELSARASERLIRAVVGDAMEPAQVASLVERGGGNPFYLEELLRAAATGHGDALPDTVLAMVQARLAALDPEARRVLRAASLFGSRFHVAGVRALLGAGIREDEVAQWVSVLVEAEMLEHPSGAWEEAGEMGFRHWIVREAVYETLAVHDRTLGHRLAGEWLASKGKGDAASIARHFALGGEPERAATWHLTAAETALTGADFATALAEADRGIACGATGETLGALHGVQMRAQVVLGAPEKAEVYARETLALLPVGSVRWCQAAAAAAVLAALTGKWDRLEMKASAMLAADPWADARDAYVAASGIYALSLYRVGRYARADQFLERIEAYQRLFPPGDPFAKGWVFSVRAYRAGLVDADPWMQLQHAELASEALLRVGDWMNGAAMGAQASMAQIALGAYAEACPGLRQGIARLERVSAAASVSHARAQLAGALAHLGDHAQARAEATRAVEQAREAAHSHAELVARIARLRVLVLAGDLASAEVDTRALLPFVEAEPSAGTADLFGGWTLPQTEAAVVLASFFLAAGRVREALDLSERAMTWLDEHGAAGHCEAMLRLVHATSLEASGLTDAALAARDRARERLLERAARIPDEAVRATFLERVPENARTLERDISRLLSIAPKEPLRGAG